MIRPAWPHREALQKAHAEALADPRCHFFPGCSWTTWKLEVEDTEWAKVQRVSFDGTEVVGYLAAGIDRDPRTVDWLAAISYRPGSPIFARDLAAFFHSLLVGGYTRIGWSVTIGNPAEVVYDRAVAELGARVVGVRRRDTRTRDGVIRDSKVYELLPDEVPPEGLARLRRLAGVPR